MPISLVRCCGQPRAKPQRRASAAQSPAARWWGPHTAGRSEPVPRLCRITAAADGFSASPTPRTWILPPLLRRSSVPLRKVVVSLVWESNLVRHPNVLHLCLFCGSFPLTGVISLTVCGSQLTYQAVSFPT